MSAAKQRSIAIPQHSAAGLSNDDETASNSSSRRKQHKRHTSSREPGGSLGDKAGEGDEGDRRHGAHKSSKSRKRDKRSKEERKERPPTTYRDENEEPGSIGKGAGVEDTGMDEVSSGHYS